MSRARAAKNFLKAGKFILDKLKKHVSDDWAEAMAKTSSTWGEKLSAFDKGLKGSADDIVRAAEKVSAQTIEKELPRTFNLSKNLNRAINDRVKNKVSKLVNSVTNTKTDQAALSQKEKIVKMMGLKPSDAKLATSTLKKKMTEASLKKAYGQISTELTGELQGYTGADDLARIYKKAGIDINRMTSAQINQKMADASVDDLVRLADDIHGSLVVARTVAWKDLKQEFKLDPFFRYSSTIEDKLAAMHVMAKKDGLGDTAARIEQTYDFMVNLRMFDAQMKNYKDNIARGYETLGRDKADAVRSYIEGFSVGKLAKGFEKDAALATSLGLTDDEIRFANKMINAGRYLKRKEKMINVKQFEDDSMPLLFDDIDDTKVLFKDQNFSFDGSGDLGHNYHPVRITDEYLEKINQAKGQNVFKDLRGHDQQYVKYHMHRTVDATAQRYENRLAPAEEWDAYMSEYMVSTVKHAGNKYFDDITYGLSTTDLIGVGIGDKKFATIKRYRDIVNSTNEHWNALFRPIDTPEGVIGKTVAALTDLNTTVALASPRMATFNTLQTITNTANWKGVPNTMKSLRIIPEFVKGAVKGDVKANNIFTKVFNEKRIQNGIKAMRESGKISKETAAAIDHYFTRANPDILMKDFYNMDGKIKEIFNSLTIPFQMSDIMSRGSALVSASDFAASKLAMLGDDFFLKNKKTPAAIKRAIKELHLYEFNSLQRNRILNATNRQDFINKFTTESVRAEIYDYSKYNRQFLLDNLRDKPNIARMARFLSWNLYYKNLVSGAYRSWINGDKKPAADLAKVAATWMIGMSVVSGADFPVVSEYARYGVGRTPFISPAVGIGTMGFRDVYGITAPAISTMMWLPVKTIDWINDNIMRGSDKDSIDFIEKELFNNAKYQPILKPFREVGLF